MNTWDLNARWAFRLPKRKRERRQRFTRGAVHRRRHSSPSPALVVLRNY